MLDQEFGLGYRPDAHDHSLDTPVRSLLGARLLTGSAPSSSMEGLLETVYEQGATSSCVGWAVAQAIWLRCKQLGLKITLPSPSAIYTYARALEREGNADAHALLDEGCMPSLAFRGIQEWGAPPIDLWPFDPHTIDDEPDLAMLEASSAFEVQGWYRVDSQGDARVLDVKQALSEGYPVVVGAQVDRAFNDYRGGTLGPTDPQHVIGGHATCLLGYNGSTVRGLNQWGASWGEHGLYTASDAWLASPWVFDVFVLTVHPSDAR